MRDFRLVATSDGGKFGLVGVSHAPFKLNIRGKFAAVYHWQHSSSNPSHIHSFVQSIRPAASRARRFKRVCTTTQESVSLDSKLGGEGASR